MTSPMICFGELAINFLPIYPQTFEYILLVGRYFLMQVLTAVSTLYAGFQAALKFGPCAAGAIRVAVFSM